MIISCSRCTQPAKSTDRNAIAQRIEPVRRGPQRRSSEFLDTSAFSEMVGPVYDGRSTVPVVRRAQDHAPGKAVTRLHDAQ